MAGVGNTSREGLTLSDIAGRITFTTEQVVQICNVTRRQLTYWVQRGIIPAQDGYSLAAVEKVALIKRALNEGATLRRAVQQVEDYLRAREAREAELQRMSEDQLKQVLNERLTRLQEMITRLRELVPVHTGIHRIVRLANELERLEMDGLLGRAALGEPLQTQIRQLEGAIERLERILAEMEVEAAERR